MSTNTLAIVIPAYKVDFLEATLQSIAAQTVKNFTVYIGDDNSPYNIYEIVKRFDGILNIKYLKFNSNLGSINLIEQWTRCINMVNNEEWIWLFSDDDIMDVNCVEAFYHNLIKTEQRFDLYRFNTETINSLGAVLKKNVQFANPESAIGFLKKKLTGQIDSYVTEYIFSADIYKKTGGFVDFPMAWASDDATWVKFSYFNGINTIENARVFWRLSEVNISNTSSIHGNIKCFALIEFANWGLDFFRDKVYNEDLITYFSQFTLSQINGYKLRLTPAFTFKMVVALKKVLKVNYSSSLYLFLKKAVKSK